MFANLLPSMFPKNTVSNTPVGPHTPMPETPVNADTKVDQQLSLPLQYKEPRPAVVQTTQFTTSPNYWQNVSRTSREALGCALFPFKIAALPITLPKRAISKGAESVRYFFHKTRFGQFTAKVLPFISIANSITHSYLDYAKIETMQQDYIEQHALSDIAVDQILSLSPIDRDNSIDQLKIIHIIENIQSEEIVYQTISDIFAELYTPEHQKTAMEQLLRTIDASQASEELKTKYKSYILMTQMSGQHDPALSWTGSLELMQDYGHNTKLVEGLIPLMFKNVRTPQGALTLTHVLLETFQMNNNLTPEQRSDYKHIVDLEFTAFQNRFGKQIAQKLYNEKLLQIESNGYSAVHADESHDTFYAPYLLTSDQKKLVDQVEKQLNLERAALVELMQAHQSWVLSKLPEDSSNTLLKTISERDEAFVIAYPKNFADFSDELSENEYFASRILQAYKSMTSNYDHLNISYREAYWRDISGSALTGLSGIAGFFVGNWIAPDAGILYGLYAGAGSAAIFTPKHISEDYYYHREALPFALPGKGIMYDTLNEE